ncbi:MAG: hypothetical protein GTO24_21465 [candidate division Zixibacteria bacterium]|nr:hypothetical protein [candidate division Zixibacteria bacterium]
MASGRLQVRSAGSKWLRKIAGSKKSKEQIRPAERDRPFAGAATTATGQKRAYVMPSPAAWAESFLFAGSSALLLLLANLFPHYWYVSFFGLTPFLYRIIKATPGESLRLGFLLGISLFGAWTINSLLSAPLVSLLKLISGTALSSLFGWSVGWARQRWGFNPSVVAVLWVGLETGLVKLGVVGGTYRRSGLLPPVLAWPDRPFRFSGGLSYHRPLECLLGFGHHQDPRAEKFWQDGRRRGR